MVDDGSASAVVTVSLDDDVVASCRIRAFAEDHTTVGELAFEPVDGRNEVTVRTERRATSVTLLGCTAAGPAAAPLTLHRTPLDLRPAARVAKVMGEHPAGIPTLTEAPGGFCFVSRRKLTHP